VYRCRCINDLIKSVMNTRFFVVNDILISATHCLIAAEISTRCILNREIQQLVISVSVGEEDLIAAAKPFFKERGFRKKNKRWIKTTEDFELSFYIQRSGIKPMYSVFAGVYLNAFEKGTDRYGHFNVDIPITTVNEILDSAEAFFKEWTDLYSNKGARACLYGNRRSAVWSAVLRKRDSCCRSSRNRPFLLSRPALDAKTSPGHSVPHR